MGADFSGYVTKAGLKCSDGRTITPEAFKDMDGLTVPLVWQHGHNDPANVLGHTVLEARADGIYGYGYFNSTAQGKNAKTLVEHKDITKLSIYANSLLEKSKKVLHGVIREVSLVLAGANPGAEIDYVQVAHSDGDVETLEDEAIIYTGLTLEHEDQPEPKSDDAGDKKDEDKKDEKQDDSKDSTVEHASNSADPTIQDVYDSLSDEQKDVVHYMIGAALEGANSSSANHSDKKDEGDLNHKEGSEMTRNVFDQSDKTKEPEKHVLSHEDVKGIVADAIKGGSLKAAVESYALKHGIENIDVMFPDAKAVSATPDFDKRRTEWVAGVINGAKHSPFSRVKNLVADLTFEDARAKGYIKGNLKKEEFFSVSKRVTTPATIYKKQSLDRDDIIDITDFDVVSWLKGEMRLMLDEELARAILIGDGRAVDDEDKIKDPVGSTEGAGIRSIANDDDLYAATITVNVLDASSSPSEIVDAIVGAMRFYKGSGSPTFYTTLTTITSMMLQRDTLGRRLYRTQADLAAEMGVSSIVTVEVMEDEPTIVGILVNLNDYTLGADKGGDVAFFDDFDIDYNKYKYLLETRLSGALTKIRSAVVVRAAAATDTLVTPAAPTFVEATGVVTIVATTGVVYKNGVTGATLSTGAQTALAAGATLTVVATPTSGHYLANNVDDEWSFTRPAA